MLDLIVLPDVLAVCRLPAGAPLSVPDESVGLFSVVRTREETSVVCAESAAPSGARVEAGWRAIKVVGPLDLALTGVLVSFASPLAEAGVPVFAVSTFDTDYVLVRDHSIPEAVEALKRAGHRVSVTPELPLR